MALFLITGGTGFVGSHVAEEAVRRGHSVRCLARPTADTSFLRSLGAEIVPGDLTDADALAKAVDGVDVIVHAGAKVGDWGPVEDYRAVNVEGLRKLLNAVTGKPLTRLVDISSLGVYAARHHFGTDEREPLPDSHIDGYTQSKVEAEKLALEYHRLHGVPVTVLRPGFIYGPRDRTVVPEIAHRLKRRTVWYFSRGRFALNTTYVGNLVDAIFLAVEAPAAVGEVFNITDGEFVSKKRFIHAVADGLGLKRPPGWKTLPLWLAKRLARWRENVFKRKGKTVAPLITSARVKFAGWNLDFSIAKARTRLGYDPKTGFDDGMKLALEWLKANPITHAEAK